MIRDDRRRRALAVLALGLTLVACGTTGTLKKFKDQAAAGDYAWIAQQQVTCSPAADGCNQLHLIKGDACFRLAKQGNEPRVHYACAATELQTGIDETRDWRLDELDLGRAQTYENLCEALRQWQNLEKGPDADQLTRKLADAAQRFLAVEPGNLAAIYFQNSARFTMLRADLLDPRDPADLCRQLNDILGALAAAEPRAGGTRYQANYARLRSDVSGAKATVAGCT